MTQRTVLLLIAIASLAAPAAAEVVPGFDGDSERVVLDVRAGKVPEADTRERWQITRGRRARLTRAAKAPAHWFPSEGATLGEGWVRARILPSKRLDTTIVVGARLGDDGALSSGYGLRVRRGYLELVRVKGDKTRRLGEARGVSGMTRKKALEVLVGRLGPDLFGVVYDHRGRHLATVHRRIEGLPEGRVGVFVGGKQTERTGLVHLSLRPRCKAVPGGEMSHSPLYLTVPTDAPTPEGMRRLETVEGGSVVGADPLSYERALCAGARFVDASMAQPWKYLDRTYMRARTRGPKRTDEGFAPNESYKNPKMVQRLLKAYHERFPALTRMVTIGRSHRGRRIYGLIIGRGAAEGATRGRPAVLINAAHHGNEPLSVDFAFDAIQVLLERASEPRVARWLDTFEIWVVPMVNPDGAWSYLEETRFTGRKNGRDHNGDGARGRLEGVDLNRNYPFRWGALGEKGSKSNKLHVWYRGPKPASEPETRAVMELAESERFAAVLSYHIGTVAILAPYTIDEVKDPRPNVAWLVAEEIVRGMDPEHPDGKPWRVRRNLYSVDGTDQDWHRWAHGSLALLVEGGRASHLEMDKRRASVASVRPSWQLLLDRYVQGPVLWGHVVDAEGRPVEAQVVVEEERTFEKEVWRSRCRDGRFDRFLSKPGRYTVAALIDGRVVARQEVDVQRQAEVRLVVPEALPRAEPCPESPGG